MKPFLTIVGSSHAKRIAKSLMKRRHFYNKYEIQELSRSGKKSDSIVFPHPERLAKDNILIIQTFGNELFEKNILVEKHGNGKTIHLLKFVPLSQAVITKAYESLKEKIKSLECKVYLIDNVYRHIDCCKEHSYPGLLRFQKKQNKQLQYFFSDLANTTVLNHLKLLGCRRKLKCRTFYSKLTIDSVHLKQTLYDVLAKKLEKFI